MIISEEQFNKLPKDLQQFFEEIGGVGSNIHPT